ncbi:DUF2391 family protein [Candidatus Woesearchaeota archaeon]|nr:DUF2391 family protein [Candidatus Woesearchaeota archaeon]
MVKKKSVKKTKKTKTSKSKSISQLQRIKNIEDSQKIILQKLDAILKEEKEIENEELQEIDLEKKQIDQAHAIHIEEAEELAQLAKLEKLEEEIKSQVLDKPLKKITMRDITKGIIGAFFGIVGHFAFYKGVEIGSHFSYMRSISLLLLSFFIVVIFLYFAGFRRVDDHFVMKILPLRAIVLYVVSLLTVVLVLFVYGKISFTTPFHEIFGIVSAISVLAVIGAGTADLIGKTEE